MFGNEFDKTFELLMKAQRGMTHYAASATSLLESSKNPAERVLMERVIEAATPDSLLLTSHNLLITAHLSEMLYRVLSNHTSPVSLMPATSAEMYSIVMEQVGSDPNSSFSNPDSLLGGVTVTLLRSIVRHLTAPASSSFDAKSVAQRINEIPPYCSVAEIENLYASLRNNQTMHKQVEELLATMSVIGRKFRSQPGSAMVVALTTSTDADATQDASANTNGRPSVIKLLEPMRN